MEFNEPSVNFYVINAEQSASFYCRLFGFKETFRTPEHGTPDHIEIKKGEFTMGFATHAASSSVHRLKTESGSGNAEIVLWVEDTDEAFDFLTSNGVRAVREPHNFIGKLRAAWLEDPDGNHIQIVSRKTREIETYVIFPILMQ